METSGTQGATVSEMMTVEKIQLSFLNKRIRGPRFLLFPMTQRKNSFQYFDACLRLFLQIQSVQALLGGAMVAEGHVARADDASLTVTHTPIVPTVLFSLFLGPTPSPPPHSRGAAVSQPAAAAARLHSPSCL